MLPEANSLKISSLHFCIKQHPGSIWAIRNHNHGESLGRIFANILTFWKRMLMSFVFSRGLDMGSLSISFNINNMDLLSVDLPKSGFEPASIVCLHNFVKIWNVSYKPVSSNFIPAYCAIYNLNGLYTIKNKTRGRHAFSLGTSSFPGNLQVYVSHWGW